MGQVGKYNSSEFIKKYKPQNGLFRVYWTEDGIKGNENRTYKDGVHYSFEDCGLGIRYEWYYKDGKMADGESKGWDTNGQLVHLRVWKDNLVMSKKEWWPNGNKRLECNSQGETHPIGSPKSWWKNGNIRSREHYNKFGKKHGVSTFYYKDGDKKVEGEYFNDKEVGVWNFYHGVHRKLYKGKVFSVREDNEDGEFLEWYYEDDIKRDISKRTEMPVKSWKVIRNEKIEQEVIFEEYGVHV
tara:strand:+ start:1569 stop:2291 length:723 start_codon:yes stop_codon:yes gene_type:complete